MSSRPANVFQFLCLFTLYICACTDSSHFDNSQAKQAITLRAASAVVENSIAFSSYSGAAVDVIVNGGPVQTFTRQSSADWLIVVDGVVLNQENTLVVDWYILNESDRYSVARQSGTLLAEPDASAVVFDAPYESESFDHDNDSVSNLIEVNAGGFPVPAAALPAVVDIVAPGEFTIGASAEEIDAIGNSNETAAKTSIANNYSIGKFEVTYAQFETYTNAIAQDPPTTNGWGGGNMPVTDVSWSEAHAYTAWLTRITGDTYRLPTEAEWEFAARANVATPYLTGESISSHNANFETPKLPAFYFNNRTIVEPNTVNGVFRFDGLQMWGEYNIDDVTKQELLFATFEEVRRDEDGIWIYDSSRDISIVISPDTNLIQIGNTPATLGVLYNIAEKSAFMAEIFGKQPLPVGSFSANNFGMHDVHGNVWEWTCSQLQDNYLGAEQTCVDPELVNTFEYVMIKRGGGWNWPAEEIRLANRGWNNASVQRDASTGFRVVKEL